jgi:hypothetical protein
VAGNHARGSGAAAGSASRIATRSVTIVPRTVSAGHVASQPTTATLRSRSENTFQSAAVRLSDDVTGAWPPGTSTMKSSTRWSSGRRPVAIVVQRIGDNSGGVARITPVRPRALSRAKAGSSPRATSRSIVSQSAPSIPTSTIGRDCADGAGWARDVRAAATASAVAARTAHQRKTRPVLRFRGTSLAMFTGARTLYEARRGLPPVHIFGQFAYGRLDEYLRFWIQTRQLRTSTRSVVAGAVDRTR